MKQYDHIINYLLESHTIKVPKELLNIIPELEKYIHNNLKNLIDYTLYEEPDNDNWMNFGEKSIYLPPDVPHLVFINNGIKTDIHFGFYYDENVSGGGVKTRVFNIIAFNLNGIEQEDIYNIVYHELVHTFDLKQIKNIPSKNAPVNSIEYYKMLEEFDAYSSTMINNINRNIKTKEEKQLLMQYFLEIQKNRTSLNDVAHKYKKNIKHLFSGSNTSNPWPLYVKYSTALWCWAEKPTLYRKFLQRFTSEVL